MRFTVKGGQTENTGTIRDAPHIMRCCSAERVTLFLTGGDTSQRSAGSPMPLTLKIVSKQRHILGADSLRVFSVHGGSIGRAPDNDWVLPIPIATSPAIMPPSLIAMARTTC